jgi:stage IV sporulation protein FB
MFASASGKSYPLFRAFGTPVSAQPSTLLLVLIILWFYGSGGPQQLIAAAIIAVVALGSIIAHELGHAYAIRRLGYGGSRIVLGMLGGVTQWRARPTRWDSIKISLAGPAVSLSLGALGFLLWSADAPWMQDSRMLRTFVTALAALNILWGVFNLIPIFPMDGGRALRTYLGTRMPERTAIRRSLMVSGAFGVVLMVLGAMAGEYFILLLVGWMMVENWREWTRHFS